MDLLKNIPGIKINKPKGAFYVFSDFSQGGGDDIHMFRYRQSLLKKKINTGLFFLRKHYSTGGINDYNQVIAYDLNVQLSQYYFTTEFALSDVPSDPIISELNNSNSDIFNLSSINILFFFANVFCCELTKLTT